ncbi:MAG: hypothetical protein RL095_2462 [Verrucomicrobiota bacterium]|jgi:hypothetical protein
MHNPSPHAAASLRSTAIALLTVPFLAASCLIRHAPPDWLLAALPGLLSSVLLWPRRDDPRFSNLRFYCLGMTLSAPFLGMVAGHPLELAFQIPALLALYFAIQSASSTALLAGLLAEENGRLRAAFAARCCAAATVFAALGLIIVVGLILRDLPQNAPSPPLHFAWVAAGLLLLGPLATCFITNPETGRPHDPSQDPAHRRA